jgi:hypothetical protein
MNPQLSSSDPSVPNSHIPVWLCEVDSRADSITD